MKALDQLFRIDTVGRSYTEIIIDCAKALLERTKQYEKSCFEAGNQLQPRITRYYKQKAKELLEVAPMLADNVAETRKALGVISAIMDHLAPGDNLTFCQHPDLKQLGYWYGQDNWKNQGAYLLGPDIPESNFPDED
tara:strand:+ start:60 stop:470 length:411 start_codon:yes stop_codon:yes gene_type:complete